MAGNYSGVPSAGVQYGAALQTGSAGTSNVDDYSVPVFGKSADGSWYRLPAGMSIPPGATISLASPPASGGNSSIGNQQALDQSLIDSRDQATVQARRNAEAQSAQAAASLAEQTASRQQTGAYQTASLAEQTASRQQALQIANQQFAAQMAQNAAQYQLDVQRFGLEQATFNYNQKKDEAANKLLAAQFGMSVANFNLSQEQFNAQQRKDVADAKLKIDTLLASKSGPGDWVQYNNLVNGMTKPTPTGTTVTDPYAALKDMYQPSTAQAPTMPDLSIGGAPSNITPQPYPSAPAPIAPIPTGGVGTGLTPSTPGGSNFTPAGPAPHAASPNSNSSFIPAGGGGQVATPLTPAPSPSMSGTNINGVAGPQTLFTPAGTNPGNVAANGQGFQIMPDGTVKHMAQGGTTGGAAIVGDSASGKPTGHEEVAYAATNPETGVSELHVIPHQRIASLLDKEMGRHNGTVIGAHKMPPNLLAWLPRAAMGGTFGGEQQKQVNYNVDPDGAAPTEMQAPPRASTNFDEGSTPTTQPATGGGQSSAQPATQGTGLSSSNIAAAGGSTNLLSGPNPATSPSTSTGYVPDAAGSYGTVNTQPYNVINKYDPQTLGSQPFVQKILGNMPGRQFGNFGASLDNPSLGIQGMPFNISMQRYNLLAPSEQQQLKSLYEQGLGTSFDDVLAAAQASAPVGRNRSSYGQAIQPAAYGR